MALHGMNMTDAQDNYSITKRGVMKLRNGFVSNSSSSSFVVLLPDTLKFVDLDQDAIRDSICDYNGWEDENEDVEGYKDALADAKNAFNELQGGGDVWMGETVGGRVLEDLTYEGPLSKYVIATFETSSDAGQILGVKRADVAKILEETA